MKYYKIEAEHIRRLDIGKIAESMEKIPGVIMMSAGDDPIFDKQAVWIVACEEAPGETLRDIVWQYNNGAWCRQVEIDEESADSYC